MRKLVLSIYSIFLTFLLVLVSGCGTGTPTQSGSTNSTNTPGAVTITVGYQIPTAQTWGALIIKDKHLFQKYLKQADPKQNFNVKWFNASSGI